jgi:hypothetical protein
MILGLIKILTEMNTRDLLGGGGGKLNRSVRRADKLATFLCRLCENPGSLNLFETSSAAKLPTH